MRFSTQRPYLCLFALLAVVGFVADQTSKYIVFARLYPDESESLSKIDVIPGAFALRTFYLPERDSGEGSLAFLRTLSGDRIPHVNRGALFGIGNSEREAEGWNMVFLAVSVLATCFVVFWASRPSVAGDRFLCIALGLILGGTLGNLYDRVVFGGVRDFLHCYYDHHIWPDFNIADCCLVCGACVLLVHSFFVSETQPAKTEQVATEAPVPMQAAVPTSGV